MLGIFDFHGSEESFKENEIIIIHVKNFQILKLKKIKN